MRPLIGILLFLSMFSTVALAQEPLEFPVATNAPVDSLGGYAGRIVHAIDLTGYRVTREFVIRREIRTQIGQPLDPALLKGDVQRLENISIFAEVRLLATADSAGGIRLTFDLKEMPPVLPMLGFLYTEENGFSVGLGISSMNLAGQAISLSGRLYFGGADQAWARATWPWISGNHRSLELYAAKLKREDVRNGFNEDSREFTGKVGKYLGDSGRLSARLSLFDMGSDVAGITLSPDNQDKLVTVAVVGGIDTRDSFRAPRTGWKNEFELGKTGGFLRGDGDFETIILDIRHWLPTGKSQRTMLSGLLTMQSGTIGVDVPTYLRYHIGGANSVRGYPVQGPDETLAGKNQLIATVEHAFTLMPVRRFDVIGLSFGVGLEAVALADAGVAWNDESELAIDRTRAGIGAGLHLLVPGSELRFEVACNGRGAFQFHLASGSKPVAQRSRNR